MKVLPIINYQSQSQNSERQNINFEGFFSEKGVASALQDKYLMPYTVDVVCGGVLRKGKDPLVPSQAVDLLKTKATQKVKELATKLGLDHTLLEFCFTPQDIVNATKYEADAVKVLNDALDNPKTRVITSEQVPGILSNRAKILQAKEAKIEQIESDTVASMSQLLQGV